MQAQTSMNSFRAGMQVHAVPDDERATDVNGKPLPWAYSYADSSLNRKQPIERGPFGRPTSRRASSRTKTATPGSREDPVVAENMKTFDEIFGRHRKEAEDKEAKLPRDQRPATISSRPSQAQSGMEMSQPVTNTAQSGQSSAFKEPTSILIYGYGSDRQASAIAYLESVAASSIYEDYDRDSSAARYNHLFSNNIRFSIPRSLPKEAIRNINTYHGGDHWIKVTFDSPEAAQRACYDAPYTIEGYAVYAEIWRGAGPQDDIAIPAGTCRNITSTSRRPTQPAQRRPFSSMLERQQSVPAFGSDAAHNENSPDSTETMSSATVVGNPTGTDAVTSQQATGTARQPDQLAQKALSVRGATRVQFRPASEALLPVAPWSQRAFGQIPLVGSLFGGDPNAKPGQGGGIIGNAVPRKDDGGFDWQQASSYWKVCWYIDSWLGTDLCGMKGDD